MHVVARAGLESAVILGVAAPVIAIAMASSRVRAWRSLLGFFVLFALDDLLLLLPWVGVLATLTWNWQGMLLQIVGVLALATTVRGLSLRDLGLTAPLGDGWRTAALVVAVVNIALPLVFLLGFGARDELTVEGWCFQATMPGLAEELVYRGVFLVLLDRAFGRPWRIAGSEVGWGTIVTALVFAVAHAVTVDRSGSVDVMPLFAIGPLLGGLVAGWARPRLGSIVPLIVLHNVSNLVIPLASLWLAS